MHSKCLGLPKREGGLGFKDLESFNIALLGKQAWQILQRPSSLLFKLLQGRYFPQTNFLNAKQGKKASYAWKSILEGCELLKKGLRFLIGNGTTTNIWHDPWLQTDPPRAPRQLPGTNSILHSVQQLINPVSKTWDKRIIEENIMREDAELIQQIHLSSTSKPDLLGWHYTSSGLYTVKSGYWLAIHGSEQRDEFRPPDGSQELKQAIWKINTAPKLKHFLWRLLSNTLAIGSTLKSRRIIDNPQCKRCCLEDETADHLFFTCYHAQLVWRGTQLSPQLLTNPTLSFEDKIKALVEMSGNQRLQQYLRQLPIWTLWRLWKSRNILVFQKSKHIGPLIFS